MNNIIFTLHAITISLINVVAAKMGKQFLIATIAIYGILANLFVLKQVTLFGLDVTSSDVFVIGISLGLNLLQEYHGKKIAQQAIWISFWTLGIYTILSQIHLLYTPNALDWTSSNFAALLEIAPRLSLASIISYLVSQTIDVQLYGYLQNKLSNKWGLVRNYTSIMISQFVDTGLFTIIGLAGTGFNLWHIAGFSYVIKVIAILISGLVVQVLKPGKKIV